MVFIMAACGSSGTDTTAPDTTQSHVPTKNASEETSSSAEEPAPASQPEMTKGELAEPDLSDFEGHYYLLNYYNPDPYASYLYTELRALSDVTGEPMGTMDLNAGGTGNATYPGGSVGLTWDDTDLYINGKPMSVFHTDHKVIIELESGEELTYSKLSIEEDYLFEIQQHPKKEPASSSDYTVGDMITENYYAEGKNWTMIKAHVTNTSDSTIILDDLYYSVNSPSGEETDYRRLHANVCPVLLPGETGFFFEQIVDGFPEGSVLTKDKVFIYKWTGDYERFEVKDFTPSFEDHGDVFIHRPTGTAVIPEGTDQSSVRVDVVCYDADGRVIGYGGCLTSVSRDTNPFNYFEVPENGGDAPFLVNMDGPFADPSFDQSLIDHYEVTAYSPRNFY